MRNNKKKCSLLILCFLFAMPVSAKIIPWKEQIPSSLSVFQGKAQPLADLTANRILFMPILPNPLLYRPLKIRTVLQANFIPVQWLFLQIAKM